MKKAAIMMIIAALAFVPIQFPAASAHYADCAAGSSGPGNVSCPWACTAGHTIWVKTVTNDGLPASVTGSTTCGGGTASCSGTFGLCQGSASATSHTDSATCSGWSNNARGQSVQCWEPGGSNTNWPLLSCDSLDCAVDQAAGLALKVTPLPITHGELAGVVIYDFADHEIAFSCTADLSRCIQIVPTCSPILEGRACWV